ncbi:DUF3291 domain-containing protein [Kistimonas asteriae]|uniref:DUF3291 domain-containing protein n=1 Tax=Kistimonas asteriae TaxID=517724 RepID=UPI001BAE09B4|nr:DUF3291 domain-containing protein [Kistimonas asteriae]
MSDSYHLAQINIATAKAPLDSPVMKGFVDQLDAINALADHSPGFVWRLQTDDGDATALQVFDDERIIVNISVWESLDALKTYVYAGDHLTVLKHKKSWFEKMAGPSLALWWIPKGHIPSIADAKAVLETLKTKGPSPEAFTFAKPFPAPSTVSA